MALQEHKRTVKVSIHCDEETGLFTAISKEMPEIIISSKTKEEAEKSYKEALKLHDVLRNTRMIDKYISNN